MYREIVTKAVLGKGKIANEGEIIVSDLMDVSKILGCWVINHNYTSVFDNNKVFAKGKYDIHVWYGCNSDSDTNIYKRTVDYNEEFDLIMKNKEDINQNNEFIIKCLKYPTCSGLSLNEDGKISVKINKELQLDVIGEAKLRVQISDEEWINNSEELDSINVNYLNKG